MSQDTTQKINNDVLASAPIEIVAELGRVALRADEVVALDAGSILTFGPVSPTRIDLVVPAGALTGKIFVRTNGGMSKPTKLTIAPSAEAAAAPAPKAAPVQAAPAAKPAAKPATARSPRLKPRTPQRR